jgi:hypothetical protein
MAGQGITPPSRKIASGELPGSETLRPRQNEALISLVRQMGQALGTMGEQMMKAPDIDTFSMTRAASILRQSQKAMQQLTGGNRPDPGVDLRSSAGTPRKIDGMVDPMTRQPLSGQIPSGAPSRL